MNKKYKFILGALISHLPLIAITSCTSNKYETPKQDTEKNKINELPSDDKKEKLAKDNITNQKDETESNDKKSQNNENIDSEPNKNNQANIEQNNNTNPKTKEQKDKFLTLKDIKRKFENEILKYENNGEKFNILKNDIENTIDNINKTLEKESLLDEEIQVEINKYNSLFEILNQKSNNIQLILDLEQLSNIIKENNDKYENNNELKLNDLNSKINENKNFISNENNSLQAIKEKNKQLYNLKTEYILKNKKRINKIKAENSTLYRYAIAKEHAEALLNYLKNTSVNSFENVKNKFNEITNKSSSDFNDKIKLLEKLVNDEKVKINDEQKKNAENLNLDYKSESFINYFEGYNFSTKNISTYNEKNEKVIYVGLLDMIFNLDGLFKNNGLSVIKKEDKIIEYTLPNNEKIRIDLGKNIFSATSANFWNFVKDNDSLDSNIHLDIYKSNKIFKGKEWVEYSLADANFKFINTNNDILMPLPIFNILFANPNYYNLYLSNDNIVGFNTIYQKQQDKLNKISYISSSQDKKDRDYNFNTLKFLMNNFYGLKDKKFKDKKWESTISEYQKQLILSTDVNKNNYGYVDVLQNNLSDRHTVVRNFSFYNGNFQNNDGNLDKISNYGMQNVNLNNSLLSTIFLYEQKSKYLELQNKEKFNDLKVENNTAFLTTYNFDFRENPDLILNSTFQFYKDKLSRIKKDNSQKSENEKIKNIVIDLTTNGGGETISLFKALSFLTNKPIYDYQINMNDNSVIVNYYNVDNNENNDFSDNDSFQDDFKFYILTSNSTFSAANIMAHIAKDNNLATIIGNNSGGGAFSVLPTSLPDGTTLYMSSVNGSFSNKNNNQEINNIDDLTDVEEPVIPQIKIDYKDFYDLKYIDKLLTNKNDNNPNSELPNIALEIEKRNWGFSQKNLEEQKNLIDTRFDEISKNNLNIVDNENDIYSFINDFQFGRRNVERDDNNALQERLLSVKQKIKLMLDKLNINENQWVDQVENSYGLFLRAKDDNTLELTIMLTNLNESLLSKPLTIKFNEK
ncbi:hypothetical protein KQ876_00100 [Mycoplasma sp. CSL7491-lung]|uniref:S41 family peptidase n=1 Tax=Mycoplasma sp. CSL7491-lung TaxID=549718 RepID=UPI001C11F7D8|nr:S41 family peptidase [Mycoplasma sp. CSL7491-lung]MBU4692611.1 hypothetical protein [Mycoplasma sp. CSL7491-lung]